MFRRLICLLIAATAATAADRPWSDEIIYFALLDRFHDGDPANNTPPGCDPALADPAQKDINRYHGGDLRGIESALASGYFNRLGITAIWLTPVVKNCWRSGYDLGGWKAGYHGYWTQDWLDIDPHLTSRTALDGTAYPDTPEGRLGHYRDFVRLAHSKGVRVIQDVVLNHAGPVFYYDTNGNGRFDLQDENEWVRPYQRDGYYDTARWADCPAWNLERAQPDGPRTLLGARIPTSGLLSRLDSYSRKGFSPSSLAKSDGEEIGCDFFSLRDLWTGPGAQSDALAAEFAAIYKFYLETVGVDGLRIDTVKHVHHGFWDAFTAKLRQALGPQAASKILFGEVFDGDPAVLGRYTWRANAAENPAPCLDSVLDFQSCFALREYLRQPGEAFGSAQALEKAIATRSASDPSGRPYYNPNPGADGLNSRQKIVSFIENHDSINRFRAAGVTARRQRLAEALLLALPGIPCIYYGSEGALADPAGRIGEDGESGRMTLFRAKGGPSPAEVEKSRSFRDIALLSRLRAEIPALRTGDFVPLWADGPGGNEDDGIFAFARGSAGGGDFALVVVNASNRTSTTGIADLAPELPAGFTAGRPWLVRRALIGPDETPAPPPIPSAGKLRLTVPPQSLTIYQGCAKPGAGPGKNIMVTPAGARKPLPAQTRNRSPYTS